MIKTFKIADIHNTDLRNNIIEQIKNIFYLSSSLKEFSSPERKEAFYKRWCGDYITLYPEDFTIMIEDEKVLGYLSGCLNSNEALSKVEVPGFSVFADLFQKYPAHLHINFHPDCRGMGLGSRLVNGFCEELRQRKIFGVHLVTSPGAANIPFYQRLGFDYEDQRDFNQMTLLFMGKKLD